MTSFEMEALITCDKDGSVRLLPGYKFDPTDEVLVNFYLKRRAFAQPLPVQIIPNFNVFQTEPWGLPGGDGNIFNERKCFFYNTMGRDLESLDIRIAGSGQWKVVEKGKCIPIRQNNEISNWVVYRIFLEKDAQKVKSARGPNGKSSSNGENA
ncbi:NAC domain-containing protein 83-like [Lotus japonicus]|uniref:NAC domain-containing protein 83-like n=1 Tax=Lotus japonicus TaxID=34305 RepID=UPI00258516B2|nr:NAC domain-containing protein 83-like [Lotus japonicus]